MGQHRSVRPAAWAGVRASHRPAGEPSAPWPASEAAMGPAEVGDRADQPYAGVQRVWLVDTGACGG